MYEKNLHTCIHVRGGMPKKATDVKSPLRLMKINPQRWSCVRWKDPELMFHLKLFIVLQEVPKNKKI